MSPISHDGVILHSITRKHEEARSAEQIATGPVASGETIVGFPPETVVGLRNAKPVPHRIRAGSAFSTSWKHKT